MYGTDSLPRLPVVVRRHLTRRWKRRRRRRRTESPRWTRRATAATAAAAKRDTDNFAEVTTTEVSMANVVVKGLSRAAVEWHCVSLQGSCVSLPTTSMTSNAVSSKFNDGHHVSESHCARPNRRKFQAAKLKLRVSLQGTLLPLSDFFFPSLLPLLLLCARVYLVSKSNFRPSFSPTDDSRWRISLPPL